MAVQLVLGEIGWSSSCGGKVLNNTDCATRSYKIKRASTWSECCAMCTADGPAACLNWVYAGGNCHLRRRCLAGTHPKLGAVCGIFPPPPPPSPPPSPSPPVPAQWSNPSTFAVAGLVDLPTIAEAGLSIASGDVSKHPEPLLVQDQPWEFRIDNGYPNIVHNPGDPHGNWRLWYSSSIAGHNYSTSAGKGRKPGWLTANSSDGLVWEKPHLGRYNLSAHCSSNPELCSVGTDNNIVNTVQGAGLIRDISSPNVDPTQRFKAYWGSTGGTAVSPDGIVWQQTPHDARIGFNRTKHGHQAYDCHNNLVWDSATGSYLMTTRWYHDSPDIRCIMTFRSQRGVFGGWPPLEQTDLILNGSSAHQLYSQITFPFYNIYLGLVMVFDTADPVP